VAIGAGPFGTGGVHGPTAPTHRPMWLLVLSSITLIYGGLLLISGLRDLRNPTAAAKLPIARPLAPQEEELMRELVDVNTAIVARHSGALRGRAAASMVLALIMLYSAAAALSRDRHGRTATLTAAWLGIAYQLGGLPVLIPIANDYAATSTPILARMAAADLPVLAADAGTMVAEAGAALARKESSEPAATSGDGAAAATVTPAPASEPPPRPEAVAAFMHTVFVGVPIATAILGILGSLLLISYFGGRRGRALYGLSPTRPPLRR